MKRRAPWTLAKLLTANRNALTIYGVLRWLSGESRRLSTTRVRIADVCGLYRDTISDAMVALDKAGWVRVAYGRQGARTWYRLTFPVAGFFPVPAKTRHSKRAATGKNPAQQTVCCTGKNPPHSLTGIGPVPVGPSRRPADGPTPGHTRAPVARSQDCENDGPKRPIAEILGLKS